MKSTVAAIKAPANFIKHTGAQHWDSQVNVSLPPTIQHHHLELTIIVELPRPTTTSIQRDHPGWGTSSACPQARRVLQPRQ